MFQIPAAFHVATGKRFMTCVCQENVSLAPVHSSMGAIYFSSCVTCHAAGCWHNYRDLFSQTNCSQDIYLRATLWGFIGNVKYGFDILIASNNEDFMYFQKGFNINFVPQRNGKHLTRFLFCLKMDIENYKNEVKL